LSLFEDEEEESFDMNEAEEILRQMRKENPSEYERIANLRDGIRAAKPWARKGIYVFCAAGRYQQLIMCDEQGEIVFRDVPKILGAIRCGPDTEGAGLPKDYNAHVMRVKRQFVEEVKHRQAEREHTLSLTHGQRYVLRELRVIFGLTGDDELKGQINILEKAFRGPISSAVQKELNQIRRNGIMGEALLKSLVNIYQQHNMRDWIERIYIHREEQLIPKIVCSEGLV
jgi:hypothetical protein